MDKDNTCLIGTGANIPHIEEWFMNTRKTKLLINTSGNILWLEQL